MIEPSTRDPVERVFAIVCTEFCDSEFPRSQKVRAAQKASTLAQIMRFGASSGTLNANGYYALHSVALNEPCISGTVVLDQRRVIEELVGADALWRAVQRLSEPMQEEYAGLTPLSWCRVTTANALTCALADELGRDACKLQAEIVRHGIERTLTTVWRVLMRLTSDEALVRRTAIIYSKALNVGEMRVEFADKGRARVLQKGWAEMTELDLLALATGIETVLRVAGRKQVQVTWSGTPPHIEYAVTWRP